MPSAVFIGEKGWVYSIGTDSFIILDKLPELPIYIGMDNYVMYDGLKDPTALSGYANTETGLSFKLTDEKGAILTSGSLSYVSTSNGRYIAPIPDSITVNLVENVFYYLYGEETDKKFCPKVKLRAQYYGANKVSLVTP